MDFDRLIKRLLITLAVSLLVILAAKMLLGKMYGDLDQAIANKKLSDAASRPPVAQPSMPQPVPDAASVPDPTTEESDPPDPEHSSPETADETVTEP